MNNGSTGNAPFAPNYTPPCGEDCTCGAGWTLVQESTMTSLPIPSETETEIVSRTLTETQTRWTEMTSSTMTRSKWVGTHEEEYEYDVTFVNAREIQKFEDTEVTRVRWTTTDIFETWTETEATVVEEEYSVLTMRPTTVIAQTNLWTNTVVSVPGEGEETTVTEATRVTDTVVTRTQTELTIPFEDGEEEYTTLVTTMADVCGGYYKAGDVIRVRGVDDESWFIVRDADGKQIHKEHVSATKNGGVWKPGEYNWTVPKSGVYTFRLQYIKNWGSVSNVGTIAADGGVVSGKTETQVEETLTRAVSVPGDTTVTDVEYTETGTVVETYTTEVAADGSGDGTTLVSTIAVKTMTEIASVTQTVVTATRTRSEATEVEKFRYYTKAATYLGTTLVSTLVTTLRTFVDRTIATGTREADDYVIETWYEDVETEVAATIPAAVTVTETATVPATEWTDTLVEWERWAFTPPHCTTLTETTIGTQTTLTMVGHLCRGAIYYGTDPQEMDGVDFRGEGIAMVRNGTRAHRKIF